MFRIDRASVGIRGDNALTIPTRVVTVSQPEPVADSHAPDALSPGYLSNENTPPPDETPEEVFERAQAQAAQLLGKAENDAQALVQQAYVQSEAIKNDAWQEGFTRGREEGALEAQRLNALELNTLAALIGRIGALRQQVLDDLESDVVALSLDVASKIVRRELSRSDETYIDIVRGALRNLKSDGRISMRVSPEEYERVFKEGAARINLNSEIVKVTATADDTLSVGDLIIESDTGSINAGVESQLRAAAAAFDNA